MKRWLAASLIAAFGVILLSPASEALDEAIGRALFRRAWVPAPSSTKANAGLGPLFNARSCASCHKGLERAAIEVDDKGNVISDHVALRFSNAAGEPDPVYGRQFQTSAVTGSEPEGHLALRNGLYVTGELRYGPLADTTKTGAIVAPALKGLGLLETIPDAVIAAQAAYPKDGVKGRVNWVTDAKGERHVGRFGWKASIATLSEQVEHAFMLDLGLSTPDRPSVAGDCTQAQTACLNAPHGGIDGSPEISGEIVSRVTAYLASLVPDEPQNPPAKGRKLFTSTGCAACHTPSLQGTKGPIQAFTDLLLHDMGPGLDGGATEPGVASTEWRTAPLWGLSRTLANGAGLLHDGRAPTIEAAIRHHGGEAARSRTRFEALTRAEQQALVNYLKLL